MPSVLVPPENTTGKVSGRGKVQGEKLLLTGEAVDVHERRSHERRLALLDVEREARQRSAPVIQPDVAMARRREEEVRRRHWLRTR